MTQAIHLAIPQFETLLVLLARISGILSAWPILASRTIPLRIKTGLALTLGLVLLPVVRLTVLPNDPAIMTTGLGLEFLIGLVVGLAVRALFAGIELAGELMGSQMGFSAAQLLDPTSFHPTPVLSHYTTLLASLVFVSINAHYGVVQAVAGSYELIPPFGAGLSAALVEDVIRLSQDMFVIAVRLAAPVLATVLVLNLGLSIMGRTVAQMNVFVHSFPVTIAGGLLVMGAALPYAIGLYRSEFERIQGTVHDLMRMLGHG